MTKYGVNIKCKQPFAKVTKNEETGLVEIWCDSGSKLAEGEKVLLAMGRKPTFDAI